jgi:hypothetical protein
VNHARIGAAAGALITGGWALTLLLAAATGPVPSVAALVVVAAGLAAGALLIVRRWDREPGDTEMLPIVVALHATAAMVALDPSVAVAAPFCVAALAFVAFVHSPRGRRAPHVLLSGDAALVHAPLAGRDPRRLAALLDIEESEVAAALIERERKDAIERRRANALLAEQLERVAAQIETDEIAAIGAYIAPADLPSDDPEVVELIAQAERVLREDRARRAFGAERLTL